MQSASAASLWSRVPEILGNELVLSPERRDQTVAIEITVSTRRRLIVVALRDITYHYYIMVLDV